MEKDDACEYRKSRIFLLRQNHRGVQQRYLETPRISRVRMRKGTATCLHVLCPFLNYDEQRDEEYAVFRMRVCLCVFQPLLCRFILPAFFIIFSGFRDMPGTFIDHADVIVGHVTVCALHREILHSSGFLKF